MKFLFWIALATCLSGCFMDSGDDSVAPPKHITLTRIGWVYQNTPPDYDTMFSMSLETSVHYEGANLVASDIARATFSNGGLNWNLLYDPSLLNDSAKTIAFGWQYYFSRHHSPNGSVMPLGTFIYLVQLQGQSGVDTMVTFPLPGQTSSQGYQYLYNEDYHGPITGAYFPMLHRPAVRKAARSGDTISVQFTTSDTLTYCAWLWYYDSAGKYIGRSEYLRDFSTKTLSASLNQGKVFYLDGSPNTARVTSSTSLMNSNESYSKVQFIRVIVSDGRQYASSSKDNFDCRSVSPRVALE